jgi:hypothetical protein
LDELEVTTMGTHWPADAARPEPNLEIVTTFMPARRPFWAAFTGPTVPPVERRIFGDQALNEQIDRVMASLPADKRGAKINVRRDEDGTVSGVLVVKLGSAWSIQGGIQREKGGTWSVEGGAEWTF